LLAVGAQALDDAFVEQAPLKSLLGILSHAIARGRSLSPIGSTSLIDGSTMSGITPLRCVESPFGR
jgi:hypothetical protein